MSASPTNRPAVARLALAALAAALAVGCAHTPPGPLAEDAKVVEARKASPPPLGAATALAPISLDYPLERSEEAAKAHPERWPLALDRPEVSRRLASQLVLLSPIRRVDPFEDRPTPATATTAPRPATTTAAASGTVTARPEVDPRDLALALERGDEYLLSVRLRDVRAEFRGRNGIFWPNMLAWYVLWAPSFFVRDEDYAIVMDGEAVLHDVVSERRVASAPLRIDHEKSLDDFDRGWDFLSVFLAPSNLDATNWRKVEQTLLPYAQQDLEREVVVQATKVLVPAASAPRAGSVLGLVVDVARYQADPAVASSPACARDGDAFEKALLGSGRVPPKNLKRLSATEKRDGVGPATKDAIERDLRSRLARHAREGDTILVYFAGAATLGVDGQGYLLPSGADPRQPVDREGISLGRVGELLAGARARRLILVLDASFAGDRNLGRTVPFGPEARPGTAVRWDDLARALPGWRVSVVTAGGDAEGAADVRGGANGLLTLQWTRALSTGADRNKDGVTALEEVFELVKERLSLQASADGKRQTPTLRSFPEGKPVNEPWLPSLVR